LGETVTVSKKEWDAFLAEFSRFVQKYELLLSQLDLAQTKLEGFKEKAQLQIDGSREALNQVRAALDRLSDEAEEELDEPI
jgi:ElaB/YqjD/DUF883 family membrane-anchored ribosome-binding protein